MSIVYIYNIVYNNLDMSHLWAKLYVEMMMISSQIFIYSEHTSRNWAQL